MDDLSAMLSSVLSDPEAMQRLQGMASSLLGSAETQSAPAEPAPAAPQAPTPTQNQTPQMPSMGINPDMLAMLSKFAPIMGAMNVEDDNVRLLKALRPFLQEDRRSKLDEASKIMQMMRILPILKEQKIL